MQEALILKNISHSYGSHNVLSGLDIKINKGSFHSLIGLSGSGKTLTLRLISSLIPLQSGEISGLPSKINYAFQTSPLIPWLTVRQNLSICTTDQLELNSLLKKLNLENLLELYPQELSGGMIQKINILRSFLDNPELILMDEPFVHIDVIQREALHAFLLDLWKLKKPTIIFVTHDIDEALFLSENISLYSLTEKKVLSTIDSSAISATDFLSLKTSAFYQTKFEQIYSHLKREQQS